MRWPDDGAVHDERLADALGAATAWHPELEVRSVLRHVQGRRITALASLGDQQVVVKVFHSARASGNHGRLCALAAAGLGDLAPRSLGHDPSGRVGMLEYRPGEVFDQLPDAEFLSVAHRAGLALRRLHDCGAVLDRVWTVDDEIDTLCRRATEATRPFVDALLDSLDDVDDKPAVPAHRDCHPRQLVASGNAVFWIDLDECSMAPAGLDVGNMAAHLTREGVLGRRSRAVASEARDRFIAGYGWERSADGLARWELLSLARLAGLAESRHGSPADRDALLQEATRFMSRIPNLRFDTASA